MTQQQLASPAGVTAATVNYSENGFTRPKIATIRKTCSNDTYDFGVGRRLENLPLLHDKLFAINDRCLDQQAELLASAVDTGQPAALAQPTLIGQRRIGPEAARRSGDTIT